MGNPSGGSGDSIVNSGTVTTFINGSTNSGPSMIGGFNTIINSGTVVVIEGSVNQLGSGGGSNIISNSGQCDQIFGSTNINDFSFGGFNTITNSNTVLAFIYGSYNFSSSNHGGSNIISNIGTISGDIVGSFNRGNNSFGGFNTITNSGTVVDIYGSLNNGTSSYGGNNTIINSETGHVDQLYGSYNSGVGSYGGSNTIVNNGFADNIYGSHNGGDGSSGGSNIITSSNPLGSYIYGSWNEGDNSSGGGNTLTNSGFTGGIYGSWNEGTGSSGGSNGIYNSGTGLTIVGSFNIGDNSTGGSNTISNSASGVAMEIDGSLNTGASSSGGFNTIINSGVAIYVYASQNTSDDSSGGSNNITNSGQGLFIVGSNNSGNNSSGGSNIITNTGVNFFTVGSFNLSTGSSGGSNIITNSGSTSVLVGSNNQGDNSSGGTNTINNTGEVTGFILGSLNQGDNSSGGSNTITNSGTVETFIIGSNNQGAGSTSTGNIIFNSGTVNGEIWGSWNAGAGSSGGDDLISNAGYVSGNILGMDGNDTIILFGGSYLGGVADGDIGNDTLGFNNMGLVDGSLLGTTYLDFENLGIFGGSTTLTGTWDFSSGIATIHNGNLYINGNLIAPLVTVEDSGLLGGNGIITGDVINYGTISPGHSIGTLTVYGSVIFMPGSTYFVELAPGRGDLLNVSGDVTINDATLRVSLARALYRGGERWRIIKADNIYGSFSAIEPTFTSYTLTLHQQKSGGSLFLVLSRTPYATFAGTDNEKEMGKALDALLPEATGDLADLMIAMDFGLNPTQLATTLHGLSPEIDTAFAPAGLKVAGTIHKMAALRQQEIADSAVFDAASETSRLWHVWGKAFGSQLNRDGESGISGYSVDTGGTTFGMDYSFTSSYLGLLLGYSDSDLDWDDNKSSGSMTGKHIGVYGGIAVDGFRLDTTLTYTSLENGAVRTIDTPVLTGGTSSSFDSSVVGGDLLLGYNWSVFGLRFGPLASLEYLHLTEDGFSESGGGSFNLTIDDTDYDSLSSSIGLRLSGRYKTGSWCFLPHAGLDYVHQFKDDPVKLNAGFADYSGTTFTVTGLEPVDDEMQAGLGLSIEFGKDLLFNVEYLAETCRRAGQPDDYRRACLAVLISFLFSQTDWDECFCGTPKLC